MLHKASMNCIFLLGIFGSVGLKELNEFGISQGRLNTLLKDNIIGRQTKIIKHQKVTIYYLSNKGKSIFSKYYSHFDIGNSRSRVHDYIHCANVLKYINTFEDLYTYTNEKSIRNKYGDRINDCEIALGIKISCPDCSIIVNGKKLFIETLISGGKDKSIPKKNFKLVMEDDAELLILY